MTIHPGPGLAGPAARRTSPVPLAPPSEASDLRVTVVWVLVTVSLLSWRSDVYFSGGLDPVVLAKSVVSVVAFLLALGLWLRTDRQVEIGARTAIVVAIYLSATVIGGWAGGELFSSVVTAGRVALVVATVALLVQSVSMVRLIRTLSWALALTALACSMTGIPTALGGVRLEGTLLPLNPNQLAMMFGFPVIVLTWHAMAGRLTPAVISAMAVLLGLTWLTGSRTGLAAVVLAVAVVIMLSERVPVACFVGVVLAVPVTIYVAVATGLVSHYVDRGAATSDVGSLNSRTIAWKAAFSVHGDHWQELFGRGLAAKTVAVSGTYWNTQVVDSSWVSAFVQGGWVALLVLAVWVVLTLWGAARVARPGRALWVALWFYCVLWSITSSGLLDSYVLLILMATTSLAGERPMRHWASGATDAPVPLMLDPRQEH